MGVIFTPRDFHPLHSFARFHVDILRGNVGSILQESRNVYYQNIAKMLISVFSVGSSRKCLQWTEKIPPMKMSPNSISLVLLSITRDVQLISLRNSEAIRNN